MTSPFSIALDVAPYPADPIELGHSVASATPPWLWIAGGACCFVTAAVVVVVVVVSGWMLMRRRKAS